MTVWDGVDGDDGDIGRTGILQVVVTGMTRHNGMYTGMSDGTRAEVAYLPRVTAKHLSSSWSIREGSEKRIFYYLFRLTT